MWSKSTKKLVSVILSFGIMWCVSDAAYALRTDYSALSSIQNPSIRAKKVIADAESFLPYYESYKQVLVFGGDEYTVRVIAQEAVSAYETITKVLSVGANQRKSVRPTIFILSDSLWERAGLPTSSAAFYTPGHYELFVRVVPDIEKMLQSLFHELTHLGIDICRHRVPLWYHEGIAQYLPQILLGYDTPITRRYYSPPELKKIAAKAQLRIETLTHAREYHTYNNTALFYEMSYQLVRYIDSQGDLADFSYAYLQRGQDFLTAFRTTVQYRSASYQAIEKDLAQFIQEI